MENNLILNVLKGLDCKKINTSFHALPFLGIYVGGGAASVLIFLNFDFGPPIVEKK